jgi:hypothetical protein
MGKMIAWCDYCRKTKQEIVYGPATLGGTFFRHPYGEQATGKPFSSSNTGKVKAMLGC